MLIIIVINIMVLTSDFEEVRWTKKTWDCDKQYYSWEWNRVQRFRDFFRM